MGVWIWRSKERIWRRLCSSESNCRRDAKITDVLELMMMFMALKQLCHRRSSRTERLLDRIHLQGAQPTHPPTFHLVDQLQTRQLCRPHS
jgi:hypothetical protein